MRERPPRAASAVPPVLTITRVERLAPLQHLPRELFHSFRRVIRTTITISGGSDHASEVDVYFVEGDAARTLGVDVLSHSLTQGLNRDEGTVGCSPQCSRELVRKRTGSTIG